MWKPGAPRPAANAALTLEVDREAEGGALAVWNAHAREALAAQRRSLPVARSREALLYAVEAHGVAVVLGATGCGKSTQLPQYLAEAGWAAGGRCVVCTQPRRVAVQTVAARVAEEAGCALGDAVGYAVRFEDVSTPGVTQLKFVTDGVLLRELAADPLLTRYSVVMVDEAHERSVATDTLLGLLKKVRRARPDLRVIVASATIQAERLAQFFDESGEPPRTPLAGAATAGEPVPDPRPAIISVEGRVHPVRLHYLEKPCGDFVRAAVEAVLEIHRTEGAGDILVFLPGEAEIEDAVRMLADEARAERQRRQGGPQLVALPLYAMLPPAKQLDALRPPPRGVRKVVVSSNIAETSVTIEGVVYVVDSCFAKQKYYDPRRDVETLLTAPISKASATQRAGRAGRVRPGSCFRLCTETSFEQLPEAAIPEMQRSSLTSVVLTLKSLGVDNIMGFDWLAPPPADMMVRALEHLYALGALDMDAKLTSPLGASMAELPLEPPMAKALLVSGELGCGEEMLTVAAALQVQSLWVPSRGQTRALDEARARFAVAEGDHVTALNVYCAFEEHRRARGWCEKHMLSHRALTRVADVRQQLLRHLARVGVQVKSAGRDTEPVRRALCAGYFANAARLAPHGGGGAADGAEYRTVRGGVSLRMHPSSVLLRARPACVLFGQAVRAEGGRHDQMRDVAAVEPEWLTAAAPGFFETRRRGQ